MQYVTGYILDNQIDVLLHTDGLERRFEKVYERPIKLYKEFKEGGWRLFIRKTNKTSF